MTKSKTEQTDDLHLDYEALPVQGSEDGVIQIGDDVVARIVEIATSEVDGVLLESKRALTDLIGRKDKEPVKGIGISRDEITGSVRIVVSVRMIYGNDMYDLGIKLRKHIKSTVQRMTRVPVGAVDVRIVGIMTAEQQRRHEASQAAAELESPDAPGAPEAAPREA